MSGEVPGIIHEAPMELADTHVGRKRVQEFCTSFGSWVGVEPRGSLEDKEYSHQEIVEVVETGNRVSLISYSKELVALFAKQGLSVASSPTSSDKKALWASWLAVVVADLRLPLVPCRPKDDASPLDASALALGPPGGFAGPRNGFASGLCLDRACVGA